MPLGSLMSACAAKLGAQLDQALADAGFTDIRSAQSGVFVGIEPEGTRATDLAARLRLSKQAVGDQVKALTASGYVEVVPDPADGRARLVRLTQKGWAAADLAAAVIGDFQAWLHSVVGTDAEAEVRRILLLILESDRREWDAPAGKA